MNIPHHGDNNLDADKDDGVLLTSEGEMESPLC